MRPRILKRHYGGAAIGDHFWPRPDITDPMIATLLAGESIKLFGLRRTGKSSVVFEIERELNKSSRNPIYVDVQGFDRVDNLVGALAQALPADNALSKITGMLSSSRVHRGTGLLARFSGRPLPETPSPRAILHQVELLKGDLNKLLAQQQGTIILLIDELPYLVDNMLKGGLKPSEVNGFLATLRSWRQDGKLPMLLTGSMGLSWLVRDREIAREHFNDLVHYEAPPPLIEPEARAMLLALTAAEANPWLDKTMIDVALAESAALYPSFLQYAFGRLKDHRAKSADDVRRIYADHIRPGLDEDFYSQFDTRLGRYEDAEKSAARTMFRKLDANSGDSVHLSALAQIALTQNVDSDDLLIALREDGFIRVDTRAGTASFTSPLVATWWRSKPHRQ
ncbi:MAG: hypothetical protein ACLQIQ_04025 [Beijerinckiaceae bacterium]